MSPQFFKVISIPSFSKQLSSCQETSKQISKSPKSKPVKPSNRKTEEKEPEHVISAQLDKKGKKRLQNKKAAIRYRMKNREVAENEKTEVDKLEDVNTELKSKVNDIQREIIFVKNLLGDILKTRLCYDNNDPSPQMVYNVGNVCLPETGFKGK